MARLLTLEEVRASRGYMEAWEEWRTGEGAFHCLILTNDVLPSYIRIQYSICGVKYGWYRFLDPLTTDGGKTWPSTVRYWDSYPSDEERRDTPWD